MKQDASIGTNILRVSASDEDADNNGAIVYSISAPYNPQDMEYFEIQPESGWIVLKKPLDVSVPFPNCHFFLSFFLQFNTQLYLISKLIKIHKKKTSKKNISDLYESECRMNAERNECVNIRI